MTVKNKKNGLYFKIHHFKILRLLKKHKLKTTVTQQQQTLNI